MGVGIRKGRRAVQLRSPTNKQAHTYTYIFSWVLYRHLHTFTHMYTGVLYMHTLLHTYCTAYYVEPQMHYYYGNILTCERETRCQHLHVREATEFWRGLFGGTRGERERHTCMSVRVREIYIHTHELKKVKDQKVFTLWNNFLSNLLLPKCNASQAHINFNEAVQLFLSVIVEEWKDIIVCGIC